MLFSLACELLPTGIKPLLNSETPPEKKLKTNDCKGDFVAKEIF